MALRRRGVVVGLGSIGRRHARLLRERGDTEVELCETDAETLLVAQRELGQAASYRSYEEALASAPDFLLIATPHDLHLEQTVAALRRGVHVLCEKPMSHTLADARSMRDVARGSRAILSIGFMLHFDPALIRIAELIREGSLGEILAIHYRVGSYVTLVNSRSRYQARMKGALLLDYAHQPDLIHWLLGRRPRGVYCAAVQGGRLDLSSDPNVLALVCDYDDPLVATILLNYVQMPERHDLEVIGDRGWASYDAKAGELRVARRADETTSVERFRTERDQMYRQEHSAFLRAISGESSPSSPPEEAIASMEIIDAAMRSLESGTRVGLAGE